MPGSLRCTPANPKPHKNTAQEKKNIPKLSQDKKTTKTITGQKKNFQAHVLKCHHCKNPYGFEYGNPIGSWVPKPNCKVDGWLRTHTKPVNKLLIIIIVAQPVPLFLRISQLKKYSIFKQIRNNFPFFKMEL